MERRAVITGLGTVNPLAHNIAETWERLINGESGIGSLTRFNPDEFNAGPDFPRFAGEVKDFDLKQWDIVEPKSIKKIDRFCQYSLAAAKEAVLDSGISLENENPYSVGVILGCGLGGGETWEEQSQILFKPKFIRDIIRSQEVPRVVQEVLLEILQSARGSRGISAFFVPKLASNFAAAHISMALGIKGPNFVVSGACASATHAIGIAFNQILSGQVDVAFTGGTEACLTPMASSGFNNMQALSRRGISCPFDKTRDGFVMAEGAGILILEEMQRAKDRRAKIYAEILGYGSTSDAGNIANPSVEGPRECMKQALSLGHIDLESVSYINAHGTSTSVGDLNETKAIKQAFGDYARKLMISSTKSEVGHLLGASGAVEAIFTVLALANGIIPPTINLHAPDPECDLDYVPNTAREVAIKVALSNSFGFGGTNACLAFRIFD